MAPVVQAGASRRTYQQHVANPSWKILRTGGEQGEGEGCVRQALTCSPKSLMIPVFVASKSLRQIEAAGTTAVGKQQPSVRGGKEKSQTRKGLGGR